MPQPTLPFNPDLDQAQDVGTPIERLVELLQGESPEIVEAAARNISTPVEALTVAQAVEFRASDLGWYRGRLTAAQEKAVFSGDLDLTFGDAVALATAEPVIDEELVAGAELTISEAVFEELAADPDDAVREAARDNPTRSKAPTRSEYDLITKSEGNGVPDIQREEVVKAVRTYSKVDWTLLEVRNCSDPLKLAWYARHEDPLVREAVASNPVRRVEAKILEQLARDNEPLVRAAVARSCWTSPQLLATLAKDQDAYIRLAVSEHHALDADTKQELTGDSSFGVRRTAQQSLGSLPGSETPAAQIPAVTRRSPEQAPISDKEEAWARRALTRKGVVEPTPATVEAAVVRRRDLARSQQHVLELTPS